MRWKPCSESAGSAGTGVRTALGLAGLQDKSLVLLGHPWTLEVDGAQIQFQRRQLGHVFIPLPLVKAEAIQRSLPRTTY
jgi:hypothetical protein